MIDSRIWTVWLRLALFSASIAILASCAGHVATINQDPTNTRAIGGSEPLANGLLTVDDLPPNWARSTAHIGSSDSLCGKETWAYSGAHRLLEKVASFTTRDGLASVVEVIGAYEADFAARSIAEATDILADCEAWTEPNAGGPNTNWVRLPWNFPSQGDDALGLRAASNGPNGQLELFVFGERNGAVTLSIFALFAVPAIDSVFVADAVVGRASTKFSRATISFTQ